MDFMWIMVLGIIFVLCAEYSPKIKGLEKQVKQLKKDSKGESTMSQLLKNLVGKKCTILPTSGIAYDIVVHVEAVEEEWMQVSHVDKKGKTQTRIIRIEDVKEIRPVGEE